MTPNMNPIRPDSPIHRGSVGMSLVAIDDDPACLSLIENALAQPGLEILTTTCALNVIGGEIVYDSSKP